MKRILPVLVFLCSVAPGLSHATLISIDPLVTDAALGDNIGIQIIATPEAGELIGAFDFNVVYDPAILAFSSAAFGPSLNDDPFLCSLFFCRGALDSGGSVNLFELSLVFPLSTLQDGTTPIVLATLFFDAIGPGTSNLNIVGNILGQSAPFNILGDEFGIPLAVLQPGSAIVNVAAVQVSEPPTPLLLLAGLLAFGAAGCARGRVAA